MCQASYDVVENKNRPTDFFFSASYQMSDFTDLFNWINISCQRCYYLENFSGKKNFFFTNINSPLASLGHQILRNYLQNQRVEVPVLWRYSRRCPHFSPSRPLVGWAHVAEPHPRCRVGKVPQGFPVRRRVRAACSGREAGHWGPSVLLTTEHHGKTEPASPHRPSCGHMSLSYNSSQRFALTSPIIAKYPIVLSKEEKYIAKLGSSLFTWYSGVFVLIYLVRVRPVGLRTVYLCMCRTVLFILSGIGHQRSYLWDFPGWKTFIQDPKIWGKPGNAFSSLLRDELPPVDPDYWAVIMISFSQVNSRLKLKY